MKKIVLLVVALVWSFSFSSIVTKGQATGQLTAEFDKVISEQFKGQEPGGVVLISQKGKIIYRKAFGFANVELEVPMKEGIVFNIASITKQFTAVAILQLMEQGKLSLQDDVTKHLPDYPTHGQKITIEHLLTHTAGIPGPAPEAMAKLQAEEIS